MQKWEYLHIMANVYTVDMINGKFVNGKEGVTHYLQRVGNEGWELVGITSASETGYRWRLIFKRPLSP